MSSSTISVTQGQLPTAVAIAKVAALRGWAGGLVIVLFMLGAIMLSLFEIEPARKDLSMFLIPAIYSFVCFIRLGVNLRQMSYSKPIQISPFYPQCFWLAVPPLFLLFCVLPSLFLYKEGMAVIVGSLVIQLLMAVFALSLFYWAKPWRHAIFVFGVAAALLFYLNMVSVADPVLLFEKNGEASKAVLFSLACLIFSALTIEATTRKGNGNCGIASSNTVSTGGTPNSSKHIPLPKRVLQAELKDKPLWWWYRFATMDPQQVRMVVGGMLINSAVFSYVHFSLDGKMDDFVSWVVGMTLIFLMLSRIFFNGIGIKKFYPRLYLQSPVHSQTAFFEEMISLVFFRLITGLGFGCLTALGLDWLFEGTFIFSVFLHAFSAFCLGWSGIMLLKISNHDSQRLKIMIGVISVILAIWLRIFYWNGSISQHFLLIIIATILLGICYRCAVTLSRKDLELGDFI